MKRKIAILTGTRAEYGILRPLLMEIKKSKKLELLLIVAGMHFSKKHGMTVNQIKRDGFKTFKRVRMIPNDDSNYSMAISLGEGTIQFSKIFKKLKPDINVILGDRDEALASALAAYHMNIPLAHIHGGDKTQAGIDEYNRHAITKMANIHFAATKKSCKRILKMGEDSKFIFLTGSPSADEIFNHQISNKDEIESFLGIKIFGDEIVLLQHPVTTESSKSKKQIIEILNAIVHLKKTTIAILPNSDSGSKEIIQSLNQYSQKFDFIKVYPNLPRKIFLGLLTNCGVFLGNSSSGMIEGSYFDIPVINLGIRQNNRECGTNTINIKNPSSKLIYNSILKVLKNRKPAGGSKSKIYGSGNASKKIVKHLESITLNENLIKKQICY